MNKNTFQPGDIVMLGKCRVIIEGETRSFYKYMRMSVNKKYPERPVGDVLQAGKDCFWPVSDLDRFKEQANRVNFTNTHSGQSSH